MTNCNSTSFSFSPLSGKRITASFTGGCITSNAGMLLLREMDKKINLTRTLSKAMIDKRANSHIRHSHLSMLRQRIYSIACGHEDLNDHDTLRSDLCIQTSVGKEEALASRSTLSRFENNVTRADCLALASVMIECKASMITPC